MESQPTPRPWYKKLNFLSKPKNIGDVSAYLQKVYARQLIGEETLKMMNNALHIMDMRVRDIMIPSAKMEVLTIDSDYHTCVNKIIDTGHSRFPVMKKEGNQTAGIVLAKDLLKPHINADNFSLNQLLRTAITIPESKRLTQLLIEFRQKRYHMAMVIDEYQAISGLVTIEDVLEEIVGEIEDETDEQDEALIKTLTPRRYQIMAELEIDAFNQHFKGDLDTQECETIGDLLLQHFGRIPKIGESIQIGQYQFKILQANKRAIQSAALETQ